MYWSFHTDTNNNIWLFIILRWKWKCHNDSDIDTGYDTNTNIITDRQWDCHNDSDTDTRYDTDTNIITDRRWACEVVRSHTDHPSSSSLSRGRTTPGVFTICNTMQMMFSWWTLISLNILIFLTFAYFWSNIRTQKRSDFKGGKTWRKIYVQLHCKIT